MAKIAIEEVSQSGVFSIATDFGMLLKLDLSKPGRSLQLLCKSCSEAFSTKSFSAFKAARYRCGACKTVSISLTPAQSEEQNSSMLKTVDSWIDSYSGVDSLETIFVATDIVKLIRKKIQSHNLSLARDKAREKREYKKNRRKSGANSRQVSHEWKNKRRLEDLRF